MSNVLAILVASARVGTKARRTIEHSPDLSGPEADPEESRPAGQIPPGGFLTG